MRVDAVAAAIRAACSMYFAMSGLLVDFNFANRQRWMTRSVWLVFDLGDRRCLTWAVAHSTYPERLRDMLKILGRLKRWSP